MILVNGKHLTEVKKTSDSFSHGLHQHYKYCWLYMKV